jgi:hypothetical protein
MRFARFPAVAVGTVAGLSALLGGTMSAYGQSRGGAAVAGSVIFLLFALLLLLLVGCLVAFWVWMLIDVLMKCPDRDNTKLIWILVIVLAGWIGALIYYFVQRPKNAMEWQQPRPTYPPPPPYRPYPPQQ